MIAWTAALIVLYTLLFDFIDIQPQVGSFAFLWSLTYFIFVLLRIILGFAAASVLFALQPELSPALLALVAVLANITILQSFSLKVGNEQIAQLAPLFQNYKDKMIKEEALREMLRQAGWKIEEANQRIQVLREGTRVSPDLSDKQYLNYLASSYALDIAEMNLEHAEWIVESRPWEKSEPQK